MNEGLGLALGLAIAPLIHPPRGEHPQPAPAPVPLATDPHHWEGYMNATYAAMSASLSG